MEQKELISALGTTFPIKTELFNLDSLNHRISTRLNSSGYFHHKLTSVVIPTDSTSSKIFINITSGPRALLKSLNFLADSDSLIPGMRSLEFSEGNPYEEIEIQSIFGEILDELEKKGYPFAKIVVNSLGLEISPDSSSSSVQLNVTLEPNLKAVISKIEIVGNENTSADVILREIKVKSGDIFYPENNRLLTSRLNRLRFFEPVPDPEFYFNEGKEGILKITVKETNTNNFDGIVGYIPPAQNEETGYLTGLVNINMRNLFGTGRNFSFKWQQLDRNSQELDLRYLEPFLFGLPLNISPRLYQRKQDTVYVDRFVEVTADYQTGENFSFSATFASQSIIPTLFEKPVFTVYNSSILTGGVGLRYDTRDDPVSPVRGINFFSSFSISNKKINGPAEFITPNQVLQVNLKKINFDFDLFLELFNRNIVALGVSVREIQGDFIEESDYFKLGGNSTLRGYREEQFRGNRVAWSNIEYRYLISRRSYLFAFFDSGYYLVNGDESKKIVETSAFKNGYGFGMSFETGIGLLSVSYALASGEGFSDGKIHFGIINQF
ncbi:MAG: BamA/TamA family outer membrane protein [Ignavibacteriaceae bacterium]|nr:BamA/TamA family outer membrane protein [Ignavibacteriaceae bacterium]